MAIDLINDMCKVLCMYMYLTRCKTEMKKKKPYHYHINVNAIMIVRWFLYVLVITSTYLLMTDGILSVWYFGGEFKCTGEAL